MKAELQATADAGDGKLRMKLLAQGREAVIKLVQTRLDMIRQDYVSLQQALQQSTQSVRATAAPEAQ